MSGLYESPYIHTLCAITSNAKNVPVPNLLFLGQVTATLVCSSSLSKSC